MLAEMTQFDALQRAERRMVELLDGAGLPPPDEVQYGHACVRMLWHDRKVAVVVDVSEFDDLDGNEGYIPEGIVT